MQNANKNNGITNNFQTYAIVTKSYSKIILFVVQFFNMMNF